MDITLHLGAHRTATTSFQNYMRQNAADLRRQRIGFWGPRRTRAGVFTGVLPHHGQPFAEGAFDAARSRILRAIDRAEASGLRHLIISDENILGAPSRNVWQGALYRDAGERVERVVRAFSGRVDRVVMTVRPQQDYWPSVIADAVHRGHPVPMAALLGRIAGSGRGWQDVVRDLAHAQTGETQILLHGTPPEETFRALTGGMAEAPQAHRHHHLNGAPGRAEIREALTERGADASAVPSGDGRWQPFDEAQTASLAEAWQDDAFWLAAGAEGLATCRPAATIEDTKTHRPDRAGFHLPPGLLGRGHPNGIEKRRMVGTR